MENDGGVDAATAAIHAAMMEELGLARRDALPLEDRNSGRAIGVLPIPNKRLTADNPAAAWHNLIDDGDSADEVLEDFADGQLYRLRRGGGDISRGRGGHANGNSGHSRGGISTRGGHFANRRGRQSTQMSNHRGEKSGAFNSDNTQTYFNDARHRSNRNQVIDSGLARLHREAELSKAKRKTGFSTKLPSTAAKAAQPSQATLLSTARRPVSSSYNLASPAAFLAHAKVGSGLDTKPAQTATSGAPSSSVLDVPNMSSSLAPNSQQNAGLATSQWASTYTTPPLPAVASVVATSTPPTLKPQTSVLESSSAPKKAADSVVFEAGVKISKSKSAPRGGIARLVKFDDFSPLNLKLQIDDEILVNDILTENTTLEVDGSYVTYLASHETDRSKMWRIQFQLPFTAQKFTDAHNFFSQPQEQQRAMPPGTIPSSAASATSTTTSSLPPVPIVPFPMNRISSGTYADLAMIDGHQVLLSFDDNEGHDLQESENQKPTTSAMDDLLSLMSEEIVTSTLQVLNTEHGGSFIDHVSQMAKGTVLENDQDFLERSKRVFGGGLSSSRFAKPISAITEGLVAEFLKKSETFSRFPPEFVSTYIKEASKKILEQAQSSRNDEKTSVKVESAEFAVESISPKIEDEKILQSVNADGDGTMDGTTHTGVETGSDNLSGAPRIVYSSDQILGLRTGIEPVSGKLLCDLNKIPRLVQYRKTNSVIAPAAIPKLSPEEWKIKFSNVQADQADHDMLQYPKQSNVQPKSEEVKDGDLPSSVLLPDTAVNDTGRDVDRNDSQSCRKHSHPKPSSDVSSFTSTEPQEFKKETQNDDLKLILQTNRGLSSSKYTDDLPVNQGRVLRATSGYQTPSCQTVLNAQSASSISDNKSSSPASPVRPAQKQDLNLRNALLTATKSPDIEKIQASAITPKDINIASHDNQNLAAGESNSAPIKKLPSPALVSRNEGAIPMITQVQDSKTNETGSITLASRAPTSTDLANAKKQHTELPTGARHRLTDSDCERLVECLKGLDLTSENDQPATTPIKAPRKASPTIEELLEKKRANGLATSKWARGGVLDLKPQARILTPTVTEYKQSSKSTSQDNTNAWTSHTPIFPVHEPFQPTVPAYQTVLVPHPETGRLIEVTGMVKTGSVPIVAHMPAPPSPQQYVGNPNGFLPPGPLTFPPRPSMLERPFSDSGSEEALKPTAPAFVPSHTGTCGNTSAPRPALSPVKLENSKTQQDIQKRLDRALGRGRGYGRP